MFSYRSLAPAALSLFLVLRANAETHTITFVNQCGYGYPALIEDGVNILTGNSYTTDAPWSGIGYLQTGYCNTNGENCTLLETTLINPTCAGCGSCTDLSLIPPHEFSVTTSFAYYDGCNGQGKTCSSENCESDAFFTPTDYVAQVNCQVDNVNLLVAFCAEASQFVNADGSLNLIGLPAPATTSSTSTTPTSSSTTSSSTTSSSTTSSSTTSSSTTSSSTTSSTPTSSSSSSVPTLESPPTDSLPPVTPPTSSASSTTPTTTPTPTPTDTGCGASVPPTTSSTPTPTPSSPPAPLTTSSRCIPRPTSLTGSNSASMNPATPTSAGAGSGTSDPCEETPSATPTTPVRRRRHHRAHRVRY